MATRGYRGHTVIESLELTNGVETASIADSAVTAVKMARTRKTGTVATAGTPVNVAHSLGVAPVFAVVSLGDAYITGWDATNVSVNSLQNAVDFYLDIFQ